MSQTAGEPVWPSDKALQTSKQKDLGLIPILLSSLLRENFLLNVHGDEKAY